MQPLLAEILDHPTELLALADIENLRLIGCNRNFENHFSVTSDIVVGKPFYDAVSINVPREKTDRIIKALGQSNFFIDKEESAENHFFFNSINAEGAQYCVVRVSNLKLNYALQQYQQLFEKNLAGVYKSDINGKLLSCNSAFARILGYENAEELIGKSTTPFYKNPEQRKAYLDALRTKPVLMNYELQVLRKDGTTASCLENSYLERAPSGHETISGTLIDITEKKNIENALQESEQRFKSISTVSHESVLFCADEIVMDCNDQFANLFGYQRCSEVIGKKLSEFISEKDIKRLRTSVEISSTNQNEIRTQNKHGKSIFLEVTGSYLTYKGAQTLALVLNDITSRKKAELALEQSVVRFRNLLENSPNGVIILTEGKIKYLNHAACALMGVEDEDALYDKSFLQFFSTEERKELKLDLQDIRDGLEVPYKEVRLIDRHDNIVDVGIKSTLTAYENKPSIQVTLNNVSAKNQLVQEQIRIRLIEEINTALKQEIEEHKATQHKLVREQRSATEQKAKLESIFNSTENLMMWTINPNYDITAMNRNFVMWMKEFYNERVSIGNNIMHVLQRHLDPDFYQGQLQAFENGFKGRPQQFEFPLRNANDETIWLQAFLNPVSMDGKLEELSCLLYDNTERRAIDRKILDSLKEKEVLLQEIHHRVKNNLQVISSILNLQSSYVKDQHTLEVLQESQQRIKSMSFIHETIYRTADFSSLEFTDYVKTIVSNLIQSYRREGTTVEFLPKMDKVYLSLDQSIPCGLIVNELVSNALKYAFVGRKKGKLEIILREKDNHIHMEVADDGVGMSKNFNYEKTDSLGIQLVYALLEQIDANMEVNMTKGTSFLIEFEKK